MKIVRTLHRYLVRQTMPAWAVTYYERLLDGIAEPYFGPVVARAAAALHGPALIVDAATGTGLLPIMLAKTGAERRVLGLDLSTPCLRAGRVRAEREGVAGRAVFARANLERCPLPSESVDLVVSTLALHHWRRPAKVLAELGRIVRQGGAIHLVDMAADSPREGARAWIDKVEAASHAGALFRTVFSLERRFVAYTREELRVLCVEAGLAVAELEVYGAFMHACLIPSRGPLA